MNPRLVELRAQTEAKHKVYQDTSDDFYKFQDELRELEIANILESKLLGQEIVWSLAASRSTENSVCFVANKYDSDIPWLCTLAANYHGHMNLNKDNEAAIALCWNDGEVSLHVYDPSMIGNFIKEQGMTVETGDLNHRIVKLQKTIDGLNNLLALCGAK